MRTAVENEVADHFKEDVSADWNLTAGIGIDRGTLLVRRLGLRGSKLNEVWAGKPVNVAAKLSSLAEANQIVVPDRVFKLYDGASTLRKRALLWSCGCNGDDGRGRGLDCPAGETSYLWEKKYNTHKPSLDFETMHSLKSNWCAVHGPEFCEALVTNKRPGK